MARTGIFPSISSISFSNFLVASFGNVSFAPDRIELIVNKFLCISVSFPIIPRYELSSSIAPIAWIEYEDIDLSINKTVLTIKWYREKPEEYLLDETVIRNSECFWWKFSRNVILPENLALNKIKAYMHNNLLVVNIPKLKFDSKNIRIDRIEG